MTTEFKATQARTLAAITKVLTSEDGGIVYLEYKGNPPTLCGIGGNVSNPNGIAYMLIEATELLLAQQGNITGEEAATNAD